MDRVSFWLGAAEVLFGVYGLACIALGIWAATWWPLPAAAIVIGVALCGSGLWLQDYRERYER